jgi:LysM repeat protein
VTKPAAPAKPKAVAAATKPKPVATRIHVVKRGETLNVISQATGVPVQKIRELNGLKGDKILVGQKLKLPK